ncbi:MAG: phosphoglucosamine mutase [Acidimicrobiales bacterium]
MALRFGTDGLRGVANAELTPELALALGRAAARVLRGPRFLIGRDTRCSGPMLEAALAAGVAAEGVPVVRLGVLPTPGVAWLSAAEGVPAAVISASHNPFPDNGIKLFASGGRKLGDEVELRLEAELDRLVAAGPGGARSSPTGVGVGVVGEDRGGTERYVEALVASVDGRRLDGLAVVVDCAHGAASAVGPAVLGRLGAKVEALHAAPDGRNINAWCGSTHLEPLRRAVVAAGADVGLALDGDADRVLAVDHRGRLVDGDQLIAVCAADLLARGRLADRTVVVTVMANLGLRLAMAELGVTVVETPVGDRYVLAALESGGWSLGGEQSGHVVFADLATTGDGVLTGVQVLDVMRRAGRSLADLATSAMTPLPQALRSVQLADREGLDLDRALAGEIAAVEAELGPQGRVLIRPSGTEPVVRVMVEAASEEQAAAAADRLSASVARLAGPTDPPPGGDDPAGR